MKKLTLLLAISLFSVTAFSQNTGKADTQKGTEAYAKRDFAEAFKWYKQGAAKGDSIAMMYLGFMYNEGYGVSQDYGSAFSWYKKGAEKGSVSAMYYLANMYGKGIAVDIDTVKALELFKKASQGGVEQATKIVAGAYETGIGAKQDNAEALRWYGKLGGEYEQRAKARVGFIQAAKASGKPLKFSAVHNFKAAFMPGYNQVVLHAAQGYLEVADRLIYDKIDYRIIDINTMEYRPIIKKQYYWITDYDANNRFGTEMNDMIYRAAFDIGYAPDSLHARQLAMVKPYLKLDDPKYSSEYKFVSRLDDGSLIYALYNQKSGSYKADIELYRQENAMSDVLQKFFELKGVLGPDLNFVISGNGKRMLYIDKIKRSRCPVYDLPSGKKVAEISTQSDWFYGYGPMKFTPGGDSIISCSNPEYPNLAIYDIRANKLTWEVPVPIKELDENSEEYGFDEDKKFPNVKRDKAPYIMDFTPDGKKVLVATTNKLAIINMDGSPAKFITTTGINLGDVVRHRVYGDYIFKQLSDKRTATYNKALADVAHRQAEKYYQQHAAAEAARESNEAAMAEYRRTHPYGNTTDSKPAAGTSNASAQAEAERHRKAMDQIYRDTEKMNKRFADWKQ